MTKFKIKNKSEDEGILFLNSFLKIKSIFNDLYEFARNSKDFKQGKNNAKIDIIEKCPKNKFFEAYFSFVQNIFNGNID